MKSSRSTATNGSKVVWSAIEPWTMTSAGPLPSTQTAIGVPSADRTSNRVVACRVVLMLLIVISLQLDAVAGRRSSSAANIDTAWAKASGCSA